MMRIAVISARFNRFEKLRHVFVLIPIYLLLSVPCSLLTCILYEFQIGDVVSRPYVEFFYQKGCSIFVSQVLGDFVVELPDKGISLLISFIVYKLIPKELKSMFYKISGKEFAALYYGNKNEYKVHKSLRIQIALILLLSGFLICFVAFGISCKTYLETKVAGYPNGNYDMASLRYETILYSSKMLSAVLGLLMCIVSFSMILCDRKLVNPLYKMAREIKEFAYSSEEGRNESVENIKALNIKTDNEIEQLYRCMCSTVIKIDDYIDKTTEQAEIIQKLQINIITTLADLVESRDTTTGYHVKRTAEYAVLLAEELRREGKYTDQLTDVFINTIRIAAPLHDIGKIKIPDAILNKNGRLDEKEFEVIKAHTTMGKDMLVEASKKLGTTEYIQMAVEIAHFHHEWWNGAGKGYPKHLKGTEIPLSARIMAVADVYDALISNRPYKEGYSEEKVIEIMLEEKGTHFDPDIIDAMMAVREISFKNYGDWIWT